jgi:hypothetical protein
MLLLLLLLVRRAWRQCWFTQQGAGFGDVDTIGCYLLWVSLACIHSPLPACTCAVVWRVTWGLAHASKQGCLYFDCGRGRRVSRVVVPRPLALSDWLCCPVHADKTPCCSVLAVPWCG